MAKQLTRPGPGINDSEPAYYKRRGSLNAGGVVESTRDIFKHSDGNWYQYIGAISLPYTFTSVFTPDSTWKNVGQGLAYDQVAKPGANSDITSLNALMGALRLGGDAVSAYDAVTLRQLQAAGSGGGATMSGVMNNHIGAVEWFNGTRAKLPAGCIAADGQLVSRTAPATSDLWAAVNSGMYVATTTDALWLNSGFTSNPYVSRGKYSPGDGTTTFRVPDLNGMQTNSIAALFLRGSGNNTAVYGTSGSVLSSGAPNITGVLGMRPMVQSGTPTTPVSEFLVSDSKSLTGTHVKMQDLAGPYAGNLGADTPIPASNSITSNINLDASRSNTAYGRLSADGATATAEVTPNAATGIWIIRASGSFVAANTSFSVITGDTTAPSTGTVVNGGVTRSAYQIGGVDKYASSLHSYGKIGDATPNGAQINVAKDGVLQSVFTFGSDGSATIPGVVTMNSFDSKGSSSVTGDLRVGSVASLPNGLPSTGTVSSQNVNAHYMSLKENNKNFGYVTTAAWTDPAAVTSALRWEVYMVETAGTAKRSNVFITDCSDLTLGTASGGGGYNSSMTTVAGGNFRATGTVTGNGAYINSSDRRVKTDVKSVESALTAVYGWRGYTYNLKDGGREVGIMAQDVEKYCPEAITISKREFYDGTVIEDFKGLNSAGVTAAYHTEAIRTLLDLLELSLDNPELVREQITAIKAAVK